MSVFPSEGRDSRTAVEHLGALTCVQTSFLHTKGLSPFACLQSESTSSSHVPLLFASFLSVCQTHSTKDTEALLTVSKYF